MSRALPRPPSPATALPFALAPTLAFALAVAPTLRAQELPSPLPATRPDRSESAERAVAAVLRNEARKSAVEQLESLVALGEAAIAPCFARMVGLAAHDASDEADAGGGDATLCRRALLSLPESAVTALLLEAAALAPDLEGQLAVLRGAGQLERASSLAVAHAVLRALDPLLVGHPIVVGTLRHCVAAVVAAEPEALRDVEALLLAAPLPFATALLDAVELRRADEARRFALRLLGRRGDLDALLIARLDAAPPRDRREHERCADALRDRCGAPEREVRRAATRWLRRDATPATAHVLIERLADPDARTAELALAALRAIGGVTLSAEPNEWEAWLAAESEWRREEGARCLELLETGSDAQLLAALATLARKRLHADAFAAPIGALLRHPRGEIRLAACEALARLDSLACLEELAAVVDDPDPRVAARATRSLHRSGANP
ncbi:MAG: hypothetical protein JNL90_14995 [Planctomycetes bacterium]|nr:hypothetical protein [Planctomycetota bacterium]